MWENCFRRRGVVGAAGVGGRLEGLEVKNGILNS